MLRKILDVVASVAVSILIYKAIQFYGRKKYEKGVDDGTDIMKEMLDGILKKVSGMDKETIESLTDIEAKRIVEDVVIDIERRHKNVR